MHICMNNDYKDIHKELTKLNKKIYIFNYKTTKNDGDISVMPELKFSIKYLYLLIFKY